MYSKILFIWKLETIVMLLKNRTLLLGLVLMLFFTACKEKKSTGKQMLNVTSREQKSFNYPVKVKYAKGFTVQNHQNFKEVCVLDLQHNDTLGYYILALPGVEIPAEIKNKGVRITVPVKDIACLSATQVGALEVLNLREKLTGANGLNYLWDSIVQQRIKAGKVAEIGDGSNINIEKIAAIAPNILMMTSMDKRIAKNKFEKLGTYIVYNDEWKERTLLARAEWLKFIALFFCKAEEAHTLFANMETEYNKVKTLAVKVKNKPVLLYGQDFKGLWYVPQDQTYVAAAFRDANVSFKTSGKGSGSLPHSFEDIYADYHNADFWLTMYSNVTTLKDLAALNERYTVFKAFKKGNVFNNNKRRNPQGGNDYWESGIYRPDILLKDYIKIFHPELLPDYELVYWQKLQK